MLVVTSDTVVWQHIPKVLTVQVQSGAGGWTPATVDTNAAEDLSLAEFSRAYPGAGLFAFRHSPTSGATGLGPWRRVGPAHFGPDCSRGEHPILGDSPARREAHPTRRPRAAPTLSRWPKTATPIRF